MYAVIIYEYQDDEIKVEDIRTYIYFDDAKKEYEAERECHDKVDLVSMEVIESEEC